jgi:hypothetical protein
VTRSKRLISAICATLAATAVIPAAAHAGVLASPTACPERVPVAPFGAWGDDAAYARVDDGGFEQGASGWRLSSAAVVDDNTPWPAVSADDRRALEIRGSATSPAFCIGLEHPTIRFFARNEGPILSALLVEVVLQTSLGLELPVPIGLVSGRIARWAPSPRMMLLANLLMLAPGQTTPVKFRFTAIGLGARWRIDDVYVDPYAKR